MGKEKPESAKKEPSLLSALGLVGKRIDALATGAIGSDPRTLAMSGGRLIQALRSGKFVQQLHQELKELIEKGEVKKDYFESDQGMTCLQEILTALEEKNVDEQKFKALKALFITAAKEGISTRDDQAPILFMAIATQLSSNEIIVLAAIYSANQRTGKSTGPNNYTEWLQKVSAETPMRLRGAVAHAEESLLKQKLISERQYQDKSGVVTDNFRLTDLGLALCRFLQESADV